MPVQDVLQNLYYENPILAIHDNIDTIILKETYLKMHALTILRLALETDSINIIE